MQKLLILFFVSLCGGLASSACAQVPQMFSIDKGEGQIGTVLRVTGVHLEKDKVDEVYLTDHTFDMMVKVLEQSDNAIKFRIPPSVKPGRVQLVVKTGGDEPKLLEQPVYLTVKEKEEGSSAEIATATHR